MTALPPTIHADLPPAQRLAYGAWMRALLALTEHVALCPFGCTRGRCCCAEGIACCVEEAEQYESWREARP